MREGEAILGSMGTCEGGDALVVCLSVLISVCLFSFLVFNAGSDVQLKILNSLFKIFPLQPFSSYLDFNLVFRC